MARIDPERGQLVVRLVYDGPAQAGKTTSVRALARSLGTRVFSGAEEDGRTLYFDWADYVGGLFEGMPIRCQIVSAPGQTVLESRRRLLLRSADAVVFVVDSRPERMVDNWRSFAVLHEIVSEQSVAVGIVMQANKRDLPDAVSLDELRAAFGDSLSLAMTEAVAEQGEGVRETFVLAIRLALDRVRALWAAGRLEQLPPEFENGDELLAAIVDDEGSLAGSLFTTHDDADVEALDLGESESRRSGDGSPRPPDASIPPGLVWPPVQGRVIVHEAARHAMPLTRDADGTWRGATAGGWEMSSPAEASFADLEHGREALIAWARWHVAESQHLSPERAIVLAPSAPGEWRLWQIVHAPRTLFDLCREAVQLPGESAAEALFDLIDVRSRAARLVAGGIAERVSMQSLALSPNGAPVYASAAAYPPHRPAPAPPAVDAGDAFGERELLDVLRAEVSTTPGRLSELLAGIEAAAAKRGRAELGRVLRSGLLNN